MKETKEKKNVVIDIHTHAFPDEIAYKAVPLLASKANVKPALNGTLKALEQSMDKAGIDVSLICSIATKPTQFQNILNWSLENSSNKRFIFVPSVHPAAPEVIKQIEEIARLGFKGIKMHPYYQQFILDEERMFPLYKKMADLNLFLICHTGFDIAFPRDRIADPIRISNVIQKVPALKFIATHTGAWEDWDEVEKHLLGKKIYIETSFSLSYLGKEKFKQLLFKHNPEMLLFGTDSPWEDQACALEAICSLNLGPDLEAMILGQNAQKVLKLDVP